MTVSFGIQGSGQQVGRPVPDAGRLRELAQTAEELGYDSIWAGDHVSYRNPLVDIVVALSTFAAATERIAIGAGVVLLPLRHPSVVAKEFASLDHVSGGRLILGVGVGGEGAKDFEAVGVDPRERGARTDESMRALRELFRGRASFSGRFFSFADVEIAPGPAQPGGPPLWVGGRSPAAIRRAAELGDGWVPIFVSPERFGAARRELPPHVVPAVTVPAHVGSKTRLYEHLRQRYSGDFGEHVVDRYCVAGTPEECAARVQAYVDAGARHVVFNVAEPEDAERLAEVVLAAAR
ncbi:MAG TPA: LLM class flavin-dependent oxidoreductase [Gaiellaceae bacterium]|nr:LLM class flavin-dependent oxidoreductase [Gaiellaceae bacterium]